MVISLKKINKALAMKYQYKDIKIDNYLRNRDKYLLIDLRSHLEFQEDHIEGAINIPLLDNDERKIIGIIFKKEGMRRAKEKTRQLIFPKLSQKLEAIHKTIDQTNKKCLVYCFKGGDRSKIIATLLAFERDSIYRLEGGYKSFRKEVVRFFNEEKMPLLYVLYGLTGAGKTDILLALEKEGLPIIDLEGLANHRGSVFGHIGLNKQPTQKRFETLLYFKLIDKKKFYIIEGESKKIGKISIPCSFYNQLIDGKSYLINCSVDERVRRLNKKYANHFESNREIINEALNYLTIRLGKNTIKEIQALLINKEVKKAIKRLLLEYYDVLYEKNRKKEKKYENTFSSDAFYDCIKSLLREFS